MRAPARAAQASTRSHPRRTLTGEHQINNTDPTGFITFNDVMSDGVKWFVVGGHLAGGALATGAAGGNPLGGIGSGAALTGRMATGGYAPGAYQVGGRSGGGLMGGAPVHEGARYPEGGAPGVGQGGYEGAGGQSQAKIPIGRGRYISGGGLSPEAVRLLRPIFDRFGYDVARTQVVFDRGVSTATTNRNQVTLNPDFWGGRRSLEQMQVLVHEITHSAQFEKLGSARMRLRLGQERLTHIFGDVYDVPAVLGGTPLSKINLVDPRFTLESIASRMEDFARTVPLP